MAIKVTAKTFEALSFVFWINLNDHVGTFVPHKSDTDVSLDEDPKTSKFKLESRIPGGGNWSTSDQFDGRITNSKSDVFSTDSAFGTAGLVGSRDFKNVLVFSVNVFADTSKLVLSIVKSDNMGITVDFAMLWAFLVTAFPSTVVHASTVVASELVAFAFRVRFTAVVAWAVAGFDASTGDLVEDVAVFTLAAADAVVVKVFGDGLGHVHVFTSGKFWPLAFSVLFVSSTSGVDVVTNLVSTFPSTFMALADVTVFSPRFTSEILPAIEEASAFSWSDTFVVVVKNLAFWALTAWNALFVAVFNV